MDETNSYIKEITSNKNHLFTIELKSEKNNLILNSHFSENYITSNYTGIFPLEELQKNTSYYKQFNDIKMIIKEIEAYTGDKKVIIEENKEEIDIKFPIGSAIFKELNFVLELKQKSDKEKIEEYERAFEQYQKEIVKLNQNIQELNDKIKLLEKRFIMPGFDSKILTKDNYQKEIIKMWISPFKNISAKLIYSFHCYYKQPIDQYTNEYMDVERFHKECDNKSNILIICRSKNEIFGGFTPLFFMNNRTYGYDNESFLFSLNNLKKYPKKHLNNETSIWRYADYGPCFSYDLNFEQYTMNKVKMQNYYYVIPQNFVDKDNVIIDNDDWILLESMEIFQINIPN